MLDVIPDVEVAAARESTWGVGLAARVEAAVAITGETRRAVVIPRETAGDCAMAGVTGSEDAMAAEIISGWVLLVELRCDDPLRSLLVSGNVLASTREDGDRSVGGERLSSMLLGAETEETDTMSMQSGLGGECRVVYNCSTSSWLVLAVASVDVWMDGMPFFAVVFFFFFFWYFVKSSSTCSAAALALALHLFLAFWCLTFLFFSVFHPGYTMWVRYISF